jgi:hypothetical protein
MRKLEPQIARMGRHSAGHVFFLFLFRIIFLRLEAE